MWRNAARLAGRRDECAVLEELLDTVRHAGESRALVVHGEPGVGKSALLEYLAEHATGFRVLRASGVQSEMELAFAALHQLCAPMLDRLEALASPQRAALETAFGLSPGPAPDRFLIGLAVLSLLSQAAEEQPLVCLIDDEQWLDHASAQVLAFVARRLGVESVALVFAARVPSSDLDGLPQLVVRGLSEADSRALLDAWLAGPIDGRIRDQIIAESRGNPLALLELPRGLNTAELAGGFGLPGALPHADNIEESFARRVDALPHQARRLLLLAAAEPTGDPAVVWRAAALLGIDAAAAASVADAGLAEFGTRLRFRHPMVRSVAYQSASPRDKRAAHRALADATDQRVDPDRRAWHRAQAAVGPDEDIAAELERLAGRAQACGGLAAAAAFLEQAATLTLDPARRAARALAAAQAKINAGALDAARDLLAMAESGPLGDFQQAGVDLARAQLSFVANRGGDATALLLQAAGKLEPIDLELSRATYLDALSSSIFTGRLAEPGSGILEVALVAADAPPPRTRRAPDLLLDGLTAHYNQSYSAGLPMLRTALAVFGDDMSVDEELHWLWLASTTGALRLWDYERWEALSTRHVQLARETGALSELPLALTSRAYAFLFAGDLAAAASLADEIQVVKEATGNGLAPYGAFGVAAFSGEHSAAQALIEATVKDAIRRGEGVGITFAEWASAVLNNGLGHYDDAAAAAQRACGFDDDLGSLLWTLPELIEAATRSGMTEAAQWACGRLEETTGSSDTDWGLGIRARSRALLSDGDAAEGHYRDAITRLGRTRLRIDLARAHLLYGEWLRRERRRLEAREQLRTAHDMLAAMGVAAFAERARRELKATGEVARKRSGGIRHDELTAQEALVARLARDGLSNPEIGTRLFISAHTVQYHLRKVFTKLGITSRSQLDRVLPRTPSADRNPH
jgi:DNA-binding CsgD family transcriptional regulator